MSYKRRLMYYILHFYEGIARIDYSAHGWSLCMFKYRNYKRLNIRGTYFLGMF